MAIAGIEFLRFLLEVNMLMINGAVWHGGQPGVLTLMIVWCCIPLFSKWTF